MMSPPHLDLARRTITYASICKEDGLLIQLLYWGIGKRLNEEMVEIHEVQDFIVFRMKPLPKGF
jgi:hypothetical protein